MTRLGVNRGEIRRRRAGLPEERLPVVVEIPEDREPANELAGNLAAPPSDVLFVGVTGIPGFRDWLAHPALQSESSSATSRPPLLRAASGTRRSALPEHLVHCERDGRRQV